MTDGPQFYAEGVLLYAGGARLYAGGVQLHPLGALLYVWGRNMVILYFSYMTQFWSINWAKIAKFSIKAWVYS